MNMELGHDWIVIAHMLILCKDHQPKRHMPISRKYNYKVVVMIINLLICASQFLGSSSQDSLWR